MTLPLTFILNGHKTVCDIHDHWTLLYLLRESLDMTGTKEGCGNGECGACTVIVDGRAVNACLYLAVEAMGKEVWTIEGLEGKNRQLHPLQEAFIENGGIQCGFCTPGMIMASKALLDENPAPSEGDIRHALAGNICRCTGYVQIIESVKAAVDKT